MSYNEDGTDRSTYAMMSDSNQHTSVPHYAWFHPGNYMAATRIGINPFQGSRHNPEGITVIPIRSIPINEIANRPNALNAESEPKRPTKKPKSSTKSRKDDAPMQPRMKQSKKSSSKPSPKAKSSATKNPNFCINKSGKEGCGSPAPFCSCTGVPRQCYRWGTGGWQSACCTTNISMYPLPMSVTRPGKRTAGRKMSCGAYDKLIQRLVTSEGYDLQHAIDLKYHWAKHGTNKFVTIK